VRGVPRLARKTVAKVCRKKEAALPHMPELRKTILVMPKGSVFLLLRLHALGAAEACFRLLWQYGLQ
jgi:hypothetical protein